jgi:hypothetical protein|nr:MAG TPA: hypothetical protein [Caudoviricetes sp.]
MADMKFGYGNANNIDTAVESGTLDERDLVLTKDTSELIYIKDDKTQQKIRPRVRTFTSTEDAVTELNKSSDTYAGQPISIKNSADGKYYPYTVQQGASSFVIEPVISNTGSGFTWTEF